MSIVKSTIGIVFLVGTLIFSSCGQKSKENKVESETDYTDTVESATPLNDNNMRNDQPNEELTKKDSLKKDSL